MDCECFSIQTEPRLFFAFESSTAILNSLSWVLPKEIEWGYFLLGMIREKQKIELETTQSLLGLVSLYVHRTAENFISDDHKNSAQPYNNTIQVIPNEPACFSTFPLKCLASLILELAHDELKNHCLLPILH